MSYLRNVVEQAARAKRVVLDHFTYTSAWIAFPALGTVQNTIPISADSDFLWMETGLISYTTPDNLTVDPDFLISFQDTGAGRNLQDNPIHVSLVTGNGQWPYVLPEPKLLIGNGALQITLVNNVVQQYGRVSLALIGVKVFYLPNYNRSTMLTGL